MEKRIRFEFFRVYLEDRLNPENKVYFNLTPLISKAAKVSVEQRTCSYFDERARIHKCQADNDIWLIQFLRIRDNNLPPAYTDDEGNFEILELLDGQYIAESVSALYCPTNHILLLQRNNYGLPPSGIEYYLTQAWERRENKVIKLIPIQIRSRINEITPQTNIRKAKFSITIPEVIENKTTQRLGLNALLRQYKEFGTVNAMVTLSVGRFRKRMLDPHLMSNIIHELYEQNNTNSLIVNYSNDGEKVESVDLLKDKLTETIRFTFDKAHPLNHDMIIPQMANVFNRHKDRLRIDGEQ